MAETHYQSFLMNFMNAEECPHFLLPQNEINRQISERIEQSVKQKLDKVSVLKRKENQSQGMLAKVKSVQAEGVQNQKLLIAEESQKSTEEHLCKVAENDSTYFRKNLKSSQNTKKKLIAANGDLKSKFHFSLFLVQLLSCAFP